MTFKCVMELLEGAKRLNKHAEGLDLAIHCLEQQHDYSCQLEARVEHLYTKLKQYKSDSEDAFPDPGAIDM